MSARENILARVRGALRRDAGDGVALSAVQAYINTHALSARPGVSGDLVARFRDKALALSTTFSDVVHLHEVPTAVAAYLRAHNLPLHAVCWPSLQALAWGDNGVQVEARPATDTDLVGITEVFCAIAEAGTLMTLSGAHTPAVSSLLPETHIAVVRTVQIVPAMEEAWQRLRYTGGSEGYMPRAVNFISGPSRTADIEQTLTFGAHGPYRVHIVLISDGE